MTVRRTIEASEDKPTRRHQIEPICLIVWTVKFRYRIAPEYCQYDAHLMHSIHDKKLWPLPDLPLMFRNRDDARRYAKWWNEGYAEHNRKSKYPAFAAIPVRCRLSIDEIVS